MGDPDTGRGAALAATERDVLVGIAWSVGLVVVAITILAAIVLLAPGGVLDCGCTQGTPVPA